MVVGSTQSGKTFHSVKLALQNLDGPKQLRRHFLVVSAQWNLDKTLKPLKADKYADFVTGVDISEASMKESQWGTAEEFFKNEVKTRMDNAPRGSVIFADDYMDGCCPNLMRRLINRGLRVYRHQGVSLLVILHSLRSGAYSSQAYNSVRFLTVFPRSQKHKIINFLNTELGMPLSYARETVRAFSQTGRHMTLRLHNPEAIIGPKLIKTI